MVLKYFWSWKVYNKECHRQCNEVRSPKLFNPQIPDRIKQSLKQWIIGNYPDKRVCHKHKKRIIWMVLIRNCKKISLYMAWIAALMNVLEKCEISDTRNSSEVISQFKKDSKASLKIIAVILVINAIFTITFCIPLNTEYEIYTEIINNRVIALLSTITKSSWLYVTHVRNSVVLELADHKQAMYLRLREL